MHHSIKTDGLFDALGGSESGSITFEQFKAAVKIGGGKAFEKALSTQIMHDGEVVSWVTIEETFKKRQAQVKELEEKLKETPDDADLQAQLKKRVTQCDAVSLPKKVVFNPSIDHGHGCAALWNSAID